MVISLSAEIPNPGTGTVIMDHDWTYASISLETAGNGDAMMVWFDERIIDEIIQEPTGGAHRNKEEAVLFTRKILLKHGNW